MKRWETFLACCALTSPSADPERVPRDIDWEDLVALASRHMVTPAVYPTLAEMQDVPVEATQYFQAMFEMNGKRNAILLDSIAEIVDALGTIGLEPVFLKGAASLLAETYADPAERFLGDIDFVLPAGQGQRAFEYLQTIGFRPQDNETERWVRVRRHHLPPLVHVESGVGVEVHEAILKKRFTRILPTADVIAAAERAQWQGRDIRLPSATHRVVHNIAHDQLSNGQFVAGLAEIRQLRELACLAIRHGSDIDWAQVSRRFEMSGNGRALQQYAALCGALMGTTLPVAQPAPNDALRRLEAGFRKAQMPTTRVESFRRYIKGQADAFSAHPWLALNLVQPSTWLTRLRRIRNFFQREDGKNSS